VLAPPLLVEVAAELPAVPELPPVAERLVDPPPVEVLRVVEALVDPPLVEPPPVELPELPPPSPVAIRTTGTKIEK
jgi:hypothetical protein